VVVASKFLRRIEQLLAELAADELAAFERFAEISARISEMEMPRRI
jgi:hypothetical protein